MPSSRLVISNHGGKASGLVRDTPGIFFSRFYTPPIIYHSTPRFEHPPHQPEVGASTSDHPPIQVTCAGPRLTGTRGGGHFKVTLALAVTGNRPFVAAVMHRLVIKSL